MNDKRQVSNKHKRIVTHRSYRLHVKSCAFIEYGPENQSATAFGILCELLLLHDSRHVYVLCEYEVLVRHYTSMSLRFLKRFFFIQFTEFDFEIAIFRFFAQKM